jgi:hypothetical protein
LFKDVNLFSILRVRRFKSKHNNQVKTEEALPMLEDVTTCSVFQAAEQISRTPETVVAAAKSEPETAAEPPQRF